MSSPVNRGGQEASLCFVEGAYGIVVGQETSEEPGFQAVVDEAEAVDGGADVKEEAVDAALLEVNDGLEPVLSEDCVFGEQVGVDQPSRKGLVSQQVAQAGGLIEKSAEDLSITMDGFTEA